MKFLATIKRMSVTVLRAKKVQDWWLIMVKEHSGEKNGGSIVVKATPKLIRREWRQRLFFTFLRNIFEKMRKNARYSKLVWNL
jgi:hypothetical protein